MDAAAVAAAAGELETKIAEVEQILRSLYKEMYSKPRTELDAEFIDRTIIKANEQLRNLLSQKNGESAMPVKPVDTISIHPPDGFTGFGGRGKSRTASTHRRRRRRANRRRRTARK
jgi:hypothetical protein